MGFGHLNVVTYLRCYGGDAEHLQLLSSGYGSPAGPASHRLLPFLAGSENE